MRETPYLRQRGERWFFILGAARARAAGWIHEIGRAAGEPKASIPLGCATTREEIAGIRAKAQQLYRQYLEDAGLAPVAAADETLVDGYPADSLGAFFVMWRKRGVEWQEKAAATRDDYDRAWTHLGPELGKKPLHKITPDEFAAAQRKWERELSAHERFRTVKCARAMFNAAIKRGLLKTSPATLLPNPMPKSRWQSFNAGEIYVLVGEAWTRKKTGLALAIWTAWETAMSPVDIRTLSPAMLRRDKVGLYVARERTKTKGGVDGAEILAALSDDLSAAIEAYIETLRAAGLELAPDAPIFRKPNRRTWRERKALAQDFRRLRAAVMKGDARRFADIRRSANLEMRLGDASPAERAKILANTLDRSRFLDATYTPSTVALARRMATKRAAARAILAAANDASSDAAEGGKRPPKTQPADS